MQNETKSFVKGLLLKYNSYQQVIEEDAHIFNNSRMFPSIDGEPVELEDVDAFRIIAELYEALGLSDEDSLTNLKTVMAHNREGYEVNDN
jgi:hypothetical protein